MNIVIAEDEFLISELIANALLEDQHSSKIVDNFTDLELLLNDKKTMADVFILDRLLKDKDSSLLIPLIKKNFKQAKVLIVSGIGDGKEKARILNMGADDYINKPFDLDELKARLSSLARRQEHIIKREDLTLNREERTLSSASRTVDLTNKEFKIIDYFFSHENEIISKAQLLDLLEEPDQLSNLPEVYILKLRKKLNSLGSQAELRTERGEGYIFSLKEF